MNKKKCSYRFSEEATLLINQLATSLGVSRTDVLEMAVRKLAVSEKVKVKKEAVNGAD